MKSLFVLLTTCFGMTVVGFSQCVPSGTFNGTGLTFTPNMLEPVYACASCGDHVRVISVQTFADTTLSVELAPGNPPLDVTVFADFFRLDSIGGLPDGLTYTTDAAFDTTYDAVTNPFGYWINPGDTTTGFSNTTGCISIEGDAASWTAAAGGGPNSDGIYPLTLFIDARAANFYPAAIGGVVGFNTWLTEMGALLDAFGDPNFTVNGIRLEGAMLEVLESGVGINESEPSITNISIYPNPSSELATVSYEAHEGEMGHIQMFNVLGESVYLESVSAIAGNNSLKVDCTNLESGLYNVRLEFETYSHNMKLLVP